MNNNERGRYVNQTTKEVLPSYAPKIGSKLGLERKLRMWFVFHHDSAGNQNQEHKIEKRYFLTNLLDMGK